MVVPVCWHLLPWGPWTRTTASCWRSSLKNTNSKWIEQMQRDGMGKAWMPDIMMHWMFVSFWSKKNGGFSHIPPPLGPLGGFSHVTFKGLPAGHRDVAPSPAPRRWLNGVELCPWKSLVANHGPSDRPVHRPRTDDWEILLRALAVEFSSCLGKQLDALSLKNVNLERLRSAILKKRVEATNESRLL